MRKLSWASFSFCAALALCHYVIPDEMRMWILVPCVMVICFTSKVRGKLRTCILLICVFSALGIIRYECHSEYALGIEEPLSDHEYRITAYVADFPEVYDDYSKVIVHLRSDLLPRVKTVLYAYDGAAADLKPGDQIRTTVRFSSASLSYGEQTDTYISKGIYLRGIICDSIVRYDVAWLKLFYAPLYLAQEMQRIFDTFVTDRASVFMKALVTGEKLPLYSMPEIDYILQKAGLSHVVAVSGMHISFLVGMIMMLFGNRRGWIASIVSIGIFAFMTGLSPSVLRAAFMQFLYLLAPVLRRESDGITSVAFALFILLFVNPFAVASVSLQLSFAAVLGIIIVTSKMHDWFAEKGSSLTGITRRMYQFTAVSLSATLGASVFTIPLCAIHFGSICIFAPITNLLVIWIVPVCFVLGFVLCTVSLISAKFAAIIGGVLSLMVEFIYLVAGWISDIPYSNVYLPSKLILLWLICVYLLFGFTHFSKRDKLYRPTKPVLVSALLLMLLVFGMKHYYQSGNLVAAINVGQGQCIAILNEDKTILIDCGGSYDSGHVVSAWLKERGRNRIDCLLISHFDKDHTNGIIDLLIQTEVKEIKFCSLNLSDSEYAILQEIQRTAENFETTLSPVNRSCRMVEGNVDLTLFIPVDPKGNNGMMVLASVNEYDVLITGDADHKTENELLSSVPIPDGECLIAGHHGAKTSTSDALLQRFRPEICLISSGYNQYGHPSQEVLDRLKRRNVVIYRTDKLGSIEIKVR